MKDIKYINIKEFRQQGYLQELNRQFLHPLGLALEVKIDENGNETLGGIWDYRDDPEGIAYDLKNSIKERIETFRRKFNNIEKQKKEKGEYRKKSLGFIVEPIPKRSKNG